MLRSQIHGATALPEAGNSKNAGINGLLARKRLREGSASPPSRPRKRIVGLQHTPRGSLSGHNGLHPFTPEIEQPASSSCPSPRTRGPILSPPYQTYDILPADRHEPSSCSAHTSAPVPAPAPALDTVNMGRALGTPPSEESALHERHRPMLPFETRPHSVIDGPLPSSTSAIDPSAWSTALDQLPFPFPGDSYPQDPHVESVSSYTADLIALGHSSSLPTGTYSSGLTSDTFSGYQGLPPTPVSEQRLPLCASQPTYYDVVGQKIFEASPDVTVSSLNFGLPLYQGPVFDDTTSASVVQSCQAPVFDRELPFLLRHGSLNESTTKQPSPDSASTSEEPLLFKTSQSPESREFLDDVPLKREQRSPPKEFEEPSELIPEPIKSVSSLHADLSGTTTDLEVSNSSQKHLNSKSNLDPTTELQLVYECFNSHGRSFALVPEPLDSWETSAKSVVSSQGQKTRKPLGEDERQETSRTRDVGACVRCKIQRVRCKPNLNEPEGPCQACIKVALNRSQKRIHNIGCHRYKLQEISLFRTTRLRFTKRWQGAQIRDVPTFGEPITITIHQGLAEPLVISVRRYEFNQLDPRTIIARRWADVYGACCEQSDYPYALASVNETKDWYREYITAHKFDAYDRVLREGSTPGMPECDAIVKDVYNLAHKNHYNHLPTGARWNFYRPPEKWNLKSISEENFMAGIFEMWFAMRQSTGSSHVEFGEAKLDPADDDIRPSSTWMPLTTLATPKMVVSQFNSINITCVLRPLAKILLKVLMSWIADRHYNRWMSIFYATFIILREVAHTTLDAYQHGARNPDHDIDGPMMPNWPENIIELHESANIILAHWHYFNCSTDPTTLSNNEKARAKSPLKKLSDEQLKTVQDIWSRVNKWKARDSPCSPPSPSMELLPGSNDEQWPAWCQPLYFAAQMFDVDWRPRPVFHG